MMYRAFWFILFLSVYSAFGQDVATKSAADSLPVFSKDSSKTAAIRSLEAGRSPADSTHALPVVRADSLEIKLRHRHPFLGVTGSFAFDNLSARQLFVDRMNADTSRTVLQMPDPVAIYFPVGLLTAFPVFPYLDLWLRAESFWYRASGLVRKHSDQSTSESWYVVQGNVVGMGARYLVPVSLLSVNGQPGLYIAYTRFWSFGPTQIYSGSGSVHAKKDPTGAGNEFQAGFQQDFGKRWTWTGGLAYTTLSFESNSPWTNVIPGGPATAANWTMNSLRLCLQGFYQFGVKSSEPNSKK